MELDAETAELIQILRNSTRTPGSVFDRAATRLAELAADRALLLELTARLTEHPEDYDGPCSCPECESFGGGDADDAPGPVMA